MLKKLGAILIAALILAVSSMAVFAGYTDGYGSTGSFSAASVQNVISKEDLVGEQFKSEYNNALKDGKALDNDLSLMTITMPKTDKDSTGKESYYIAGTSDYDDVVISVARLNRVKGEYELIHNTNGDSYWGVSGGIFSAKILLVDGVNNLMFITYRKSEMEAGKIQFNSVTIQLLPPEITDNAVEKKQIDFGASIMNNIENTIDRFSGKSK